VNVASGGSATLRGGQVTSNVNGWRIARTVCKSITAGAASGNLAKDVKDSVWARLASVAWLFALITRL